MKQFDDSDAGIRPGGIATMASLMVGISLEREAIEELRAALGGPLFLPGEAEYDIARQLWNGMIDKHPALIVRPTGVFDIRLAVQFAASNGLSVSIKGGGHNVAGHAVGDDSLMFDMSAMRGVRVDPKRHTAWVQAGALWGDLDRETSVFGLATTGGVVASTGVAGLTLGGGIGWLVGKHGMSIDNLLSIEIVTADGEFLIANAESHSDLFWALRGGGGNFGVVTAFEFALHPVSTVLAGFVAYPVSEARSVLEFYRDFALSTPDELTVYCQLCTDPESGMRIVVIVGCWSGDLVEGEAIFAPLRQFGAPVMDTIQQVSYQEWQRAFEEENPHGLRYYWKGTLFDELSDDALDIIDDLASLPELPRCIAAIECYRGKLNRVDPTATAFPHRSARFQLVTIGGWEDPTDDAAGANWVRNLTTALAPHALNGSFLNFNALESADRSERVRAGFGMNWDRLVAIKRRYDPTNVFRENNNIAV
jgi:FAD/FMN-containing dehydrogenase